MRKMVLIMMSLILAGCAAGTSRYNLLTEKDNPEIAVRIFDVRGAEGHHTDDSDFGTLFAQYLAGNLQSSGYKAMVVDKDMDVAKFKYVVDGKFSQIEGGNWALRFWIGCGAGAARMTVLVKLIRTADNIELGNVKDSVSALFIQGQKTSLLRIVDKLSKNISIQLSSLIQKDEKNIK
jgi:hypothetical protein